MNDYTKGILTGASLILCFFMFVSAKSQSKNLGDITVDSVVVVDENGQPVGLLGSVEESGFLALNRAGTEPFLGLVCEKEGGRFYSYNADGKTTASLGTGEGGDGNLETKNADGKMTTLLGTGVDVGGGGVLYTFNKHEVMVGYFGNGNNGKDIIEDGMAVLFDRYGDIGWFETGKR